MSSKSHPLANVKPLGSLSLGCLTINITDTNRDTYQPLSAAGQPTEPEIEINELGSYKDTQSSSKSSKLRSLISLLTASCNKHKQSGIDLTATKFANYKLRNQDPWFRTICKEPEARKWLEDKIFKKKDVYLVVGLLVLTNAKLSTSSNITKEVAGFLKASILPAGFAIPGTAMDFLSGAGLTRDAVCNSSYKVEAPGDQIFGVWYRKIKFQWFFSRKLDHASLCEHTRWRPFGEWRGANTADEIQDEEDIVEVSLEEECDWEDDIGSNERDCQGGVCDVGTIQVANEGGVTERMEAHLDVTNAQLNATAQVLSNKASALRWF